MVSTMSETSKRIFKSSFCFPALNFITWIGANDLEVEGHFVWASDNSTLNPALWGKSTPDNWLNPYTNERENCVSLFVNENSTRLNDASCSLNYSLICQSGKASFI